MKAIEPPGGLLLCVLGRRDARWEEYISSETWQSSGCTATKLQHRNTCPADSCRGRVYYCDLRPHWLHDNPLFSAPISALSSWQRRWQIISSYRTSGRDWRKGGRKVKPRFLPQHRYHHHLSTVIHTLAHRISDSRLPHHRKRVTGIKRNIKAKENIKEKEDMKNQRGRTRDIWKGYHIRCWRCCTSLVVDFG